MFVTVEQCKRIIQNYLQNSGRGGFRTGVVKSTNPLVINVGSKMELGAESLQITDNCIGLKVNGKELRSPLKPGDGVLLLCRPDSVSGVIFIILDRIQPYTPIREVTL